MGILSSSVSITRYIVKDKIEGNILETIFTGLNKNKINDIDKTPMVKESGWTSFDSPYDPDFKNSSSVIGSHLFFSLRIDKKTIPSKTIKKFCSIAIKNKLEETGREKLTRNEIKIIKDSVVNMLSIKIPATPNIYDIIWNYEESRLWFFTNLKSANEELETIFLKSFNVSLIRIFPYTAANLSMSLSDNEKDIINSLSPSIFRK